jgi:hypothetical protein
MVMDLLQRATAADVEAALRAAGDKLWVRRSAARIYRDTLGDLAAARRALDGLDPLTCIEWRLAAAAWAELGDLAAATRCLERGAANARSASDQCTIALGYFDAGFADEARLLVDGAAALAGRALDAWVVANLYRDTFGDPARALATLQRALGDATAVGELVGFAHALETYGAADAVDDCLYTAARRASTVHDWIEVALAHHRIRRDDAAARRSLDEGARLATSPQDERELAYARGRTHLELLDEDRPRVAPSRLLRPGTRAFGWDRDAGRLLAWLRAVMPRTSIDALIRPGAYFVQDDLRELLGIAKTGLVPNPLPAYLHVLETVRWRGPPAIDHMTRAFACTLLLIDDAASGQPETHEPTCAILLTSCLELGPDAVEGALALFAALADAYELAQATRMVLFAELALALGAAWLDPTDPRLPALVDRLMADEARERIRAPARPPWLLGLAPDDRRDAEWRGLAIQVLDRDHIHRLVGALVPLLSRLR